MQSEPGLPEADQRLRPVAEPASAALEARNDGPLLTFYDLFASISTLN